MFGNEGTHRRMLAAVLAFAAPAFLLTACNDDPLFDLPPGQPTDVQATIAGDDVTLSWTRGENATSQEVRLSPVQAVPASAGNALQATDLVETLGAEATTYTFVDVAPGTYEATVSAINSSATVRSDPISVLIAEPQLAPTNVSVNVDGQNAIVSWTPGEQAVSQIITLTSTGLPDEIVPIDNNTTTSYQFTDLAPAEYTVVVTAVDAASAEYDSDPETFTIVPANAPTIVTFGEAEGDPTSVFVEWTTVESADQYKVTLTPDEGDDIVAIVELPDTSVVLGPDEGVQDGVTYSVVVCTLIGTEESCTTPDAVPPFTVNHFLWDEFLPTSLHATGAGKSTFYNATNGGFERFTGVPYDQLICKGCHQSITDGDCTACHVGDPNPQLGAVIEDQATVCGACHSRQGSEVSLGFGDVHRDAGVTCSVCHGLEDVHGDGNEYASLLDDGAVDAACENCHNADSDPPIDPATHSGHGDALDCSTCHMKTVTTCYNCHFETELDFDRKVFYGPPPYPGPEAAGNSWVFLGNRVYGDGSTKVHLMNLQSLKFGTVADGDAVGFAAIAPYYGHTIMPAEDARGCGDCHVNVIGPGGSAAQEYNASGQITIAEWDADAGVLLRPHNGIIPIPPDYLTSLQFDFVDLVDPANPPANGSDPTSWQFLKAGADTIQILEQYGAPLTEDQMTKLGIVSPTP